MAVVKRTPPKTADDASMPPPPPRPPKRQKLVLDEDEYVATMDAIIERDYFPDIPVLKATLAGLSDPGDGDDDDDRGPPASSSRSAAASVQHETPALTENDARRLATPQASPARPLQAIGGNDVNGGPSARNPGGCSAGPSGAEQSGEVTDAGGLAGASSLDEFLNRYTSADNASFEELQREALRRKAARREQQPTTTTPEAAMLAIEDGDAEAVTDHRPTDGYGTSGQPADTLVMWPHTAKNKLYYDSAETGVAKLTDAEAADRAIGPPKRILKANTRFPSAAAVAAATLEQPGGATSLRFPPPSRSDGDPASGGDGRRQLLATPSPAPGVVDESPMMTWGELAGTPVRLDPDRIDDRMPFRVQELPRRDRLGQELAHGARRSLLARSRRKAAAASIGGLRTPLSLSRPSSAGGGSRGPASASAAAGGGWTTTPGRFLSVAGRRLASSLSRGRTPNTDMQLRASYSGTPKTSHSGWREGTTPLRVGRRKEGRTSGTGGQQTPGLGLAAAEEAGGGEARKGNITDGLLEI